MKEAKGLYCVELVGLDGNKSYLSHKTRSAWSLRQAQRHASDVRKGCCAVKLKDYKAVKVVPN